MKAQRTEKYLQSARYWIGLAARDMRLRMPEDGDGRRVIEHQLKKLKMATGICSNVEDAIAIEEARRVRS